MKNICVVGGGIAGLFAARVLAEKNYQVKVLEGAAEPGGLLRSFHGPHGQDFDYGTHVMRETGHSEVDALMFSHLSDEWRSFEILKTGSVAGGQLYKHSAFINGNSLSPEDLTKAESEFLNGTPVKKELDSAKDYVYQSYGPTYSEKLFLPALAKFYGVPTEELHKNALRQFGMTRMVGFTSEKTHELKKDSWGDERLAFHSFEEGSAGLNNFYPRTGGIGRFITELRADLESRGVEVLCNQKIESVQVKDGKVSSLQVGGQSFDLDHLVWTLPVPFLHKMAGQSSPAKELKFRDVGLFYFTFEEPLTTDLYYIMNFDPDLHSFRITFYQNLKANNEKHFSCCVEVLGSGADIEKLSSSEVLEELKGLGLVKSEVLPVEEQKMTFPKGFPIMTKDFAKSSREGYDEAMKLYSNVSLVGRSAGKVFFTNDVLIDTYELLNSL